MKLPYLRSDLGQFVAYTPHPGGDVVSTHLPDRLDTNESPFDLPDEVKQKLAWMFQQEIEANRYPDGSHADLKGAIAEYVNEFELTTPITPAQLSVGNGSDELIRAALIATCLGGEGSILVATPTFSMYGILAKTLGIPVHTIGRSEATFELDLEAANQAIAQAASPPIRVVCMVHPNSPTANAMTEAELAWLRSLPDEILVIVDEAYFEFSQTSVVNELANYPNWLILRTFSKAFRLASLRVGYAIGHPEFIAALEKVRLPYNLPQFSQTAALLTLSQRDQLLEAIPMILEERQRLQDMLCQQPALQVWPSQSNFLYFRLSEAAIAILSLSQDDALEQLFLDLKATGTLVRHTGGGIRLTVGSPDENTRTLEHLRQCLPPC